jgi:hypothetical protein
MPSPFPGMDPYLEHPRLFPGFHRWLIMALAEDLNLALRPRYWVSVEERAYVAVPEVHLTVGVPDAMVVAGSDAPRKAGSAAVLERGLEVGVPVPETIRERYLEIHDATNRKVVTVVEVLSPTNKRRGPGLKEYLQKREAVVGSLTNLVEVDLLRAGTRMPVLRPQGSYDYGIIVCRAKRAAHAVLYSFSVRDPLPAFPIPLKPGDPDAALELGRVFNHAYESGSYDLMLDYSCEPVPPLSKDDEAWADALLREKGLR